jgi:hypothetical protein
MGRDFSYILGLVSLEKTWLFVRIEGVSVLLKRLAKQKY